MKSHTVIYAGKPWEITHGHPMPEPATKKKTGVPGRYTFPFAALSVGDSFDVQPDQWDQYNGNGFDVERCQNRVSRAFCNYRGRMKKRRVYRNFTTRQIHGGNASFVRCWRIK